MYNSNCFGPWYTRRQLNKIHEKCPNGHSSTSTFTYGGKFESKTIEDFLGFKVGWKIYGSLCYVTTEFWKSFTPAQLFIPNILDITITAVPQNADNYSYLVVCHPTNDCVVVDAGDAKPIMDCLGTEKVPQAVLVTHKHWYFLNSFSWVLKHWTYRIVKLPTVLMFPGITATATKNLRGITRSWIYMVVRLIDLLMSTGACLPCYAFWISFSWNVSGCSISSCRKCLS